jgi:hypothetical protein
MDILDILLCVLLGLIGLCLLCMLVKWTYEKAKQAIINDAQILLAAQEKAWLDAEFLDAATAILDAVQEE